jgi:hypothetical protein
MHIPRFGHELDMSPFEIAQTSQHLSRQLATGPSSTVPLDQLPPWMFDSLGPTLNGSLWAMIAVSALFLGVRLYCKFWKQKGLWWDDYVLTASWVCCSHPLFQPRLFPLYSCVSYVAGPTPGQRHHREH